MQSHRSLGWLVLFSALLSSVCFWFVLPLFAAPAELPTANLVVNGDFETGNIAPWTNQIGGGSGGINSNLTLVHAGNFSAQVTSGTTAGSSSGIGGGGGCAGGVRIAVNPSTSYTFSGYILVPSATANFLNARLRVAWYASGNCSTGSQISTRDSNVVTTLSDTWVPVTGTGTSPATAAFAEIRLLVAPLAGGASTTAYFDDVTMDLTNPPTSTPTFTLTDTSTATPLPTDTPTSTPTDTHTPTGTSTDISTDTPTWTSTPTETPTETYTPVDTDTPTSTSTVTPTETPTSTPTDTPTETPTTRYQIVISQVYGGGGNTGAPYQNDFIELLNRGDTTVSLAGWSLQYASATGIGNFGANVGLITPLAGSLAPGQYLLVQEASGGAVGLPLPAPDLVDSTPINLNATSGKIALVNIITPLGCNGGSTPCPPGALAAIVDLVGYGNANFFEGSGAAPAAGNATSELRARGGCTDTEDNAADFSTGAPTPRNSAQFAACGATPTSTYTPTATDSPTPTSSYTPSPTYTPTYTSTPVAVGLYVNEFLPHPVSDWNGDGVVNQNDEWIELYNANDFSVALEGWQLDDAPGGGSAPYTLPAGTTIAPHGFTLWFHSQTHVILNDNGDDVRLLHPDGTLADIISYSSSSPDKSYSRNPDGARYVTDYCPPTPGRPNCSIPPTPTFTPTPYSTGAVLNEFLPRPYRDWNHDGVIDSNDEWIELYNNSEQEIDLSGWKLDDVAGGSSPYALPANTRLTPRGYLLLFGNQTHIGLNNEGDTVRLLHPDNTVADAKVYQVTVPDQAYGRRPDGTGAWQTACYPTPGRRNCSIVIPPAPTPVYQFTTLPEARTLPAGSRVTVRGSVIARPCQLDQYGHALMISDGAVGLALYLPYPEQLTCATAMHEQIAATGVLTDHYGLRELQLETARDFIRNYDVPSEILSRPIRTGELGGEFESMLVTVQGTVVNGQNGDTIWVDDGSGAVEIRAVPASGASFAGITHSSIVRVTGVGYHYNRFKLPEEGYYLEPRMPEDVDMLELADRVPPAPGGRGHDLGAVSVNTAHTTRTQNYVLLGGVVTVPPGVLGKRDFWIQDASGGVHVYVSSSAGQVPALDLWDNITVRGRVVSEYGEREVRLEEPSSVNVYGSAAPLPTTPLATGQVTLAYEGALVEISGAVMRGDKREWYLDDGTGELLVYIDANTRIHWPTLNAGTKLTVTGVVRRYQGRPELEPRFQSDLVFENAHQSTNSSSLAGLDVGASGAALDEAPARAARAGGQIGAPLAQPRRLRAHAASRASGDTLILNSQMGVHLSEPLNLLLAVAWVPLLAASAGMTVLAIAKYLKRNQKRARGGPESS